MKTLLSSVTILDLIATRPTSPQSLAPLVAVRANASVVDVISRMTHAKILSVPVVNDNRKLLGFVDMFDIANFLVQSLPPTTAKSGDGSRAQQELISGDRIFTDLIINRKASSFINYSGMNQTVALPLTASAMEAAEVFAQGYHRLAVMWDRRFDRVQSQNLPPAVTEGELWSICSQTDLLRYLHARLPSISERDVAQLGEKTIDEAGLVQTEETFDMAHDPAVIHISQDATVMQAMQKVASTGASALAVLDPATGSLVGNFSASDLRLLFQRDDHSGGRVGGVGGAGIGVGDDVLAGLSQKLQLSVHDFLKKYSPLSLDLAVLTPQDKLFNALDIMSNRRIHHVFVVDSSRDTGSSSILQKMKDTAGSLLGDNKGKIGALRGIVTQTDLCRHFMGLPRMFNSETQQASAAVTGGALPASRGAGSPRLLSE